VFRDKDSQMTIDITVTRRSLLKAGLGAALWGMTPSLASAFTAKETRSLAFYNTHTSESLQAVYWENGHYNEEVLQHVHHILRDFRTDEVKPIDKKLLDMLAAIHHKMETSQPFEIISGYRSPHTNQMLHEHTQGVATASQHLLGKAIDVRLPGRQLVHLRDMAKSMQQGGVGYYATSNFVHIDTGRVRYW